MIPGSARLTIFRSFPKQLLARFTGRFGVSFLLPQRKFGATAMADSFSVGIRKLAKKCNSFFNEGLGFAQVCSYVFVAEKMAMLGLCSL